MQKKPCAAQCNLNLDGEMFVFSLPSVTVVTSMLIRNLNHVSTLAVKIRLSIKSVSFLVTKVFQKCFQTLYFTHKYV